jgi:hypothetical protein
MNVRLHSLPFLLAALLTMAVAVACVEPIVDEGASRELTVRVVVPTADLVTKADVAAVGNEDKMYDIRIWAFDHAETGDDAKAVGYGSATIAAGATSQNVTVTFPNSVNGKLDNEPSVSVDLYVVANGASVGFTQADLENVNVTRKYLEEFVLNDAKGAAGFGTACVSQVPDTGLPMSAVKDNVDITFLKNGGTHDSVEIKLKRAVAKIRFVFAKAANMIDDASGDLISTKINSIQLINLTTEYAVGWEDMLSRSTYLFPRETPKSSATLKWPANSTQEPLVPNTSFVGKTVDTPLRLRNDYQNKDIVAYEAFLDDEIVAGHAIERILYLRECDQYKTRVAARINYTIGTATERTVEIEIPSGALLNRNTWWTIYAYFMSFDLGFEVTVHEDWDVYNGGAISVSG